MDPQVGYICIYVMYIYVRYVCVYVCMYVCCWLRAVGYHVCMYVCLSCLYIRLSICTYVYCAYRIAYLPKVRSGSRAVKKQKDGELAMTSFFWSPPSTQNSMWRFIPARL